MPALSNCKLQLRFGSSSGRETEFYDAMFSPSNNEVIYHMYSGGFSRWLVASEVQF